MNNLNFHNSLHKSSIKEDLKKPIKEPYILCAFMQVPVTPAVMRTESNLNNKCQMDRWNPIENTCGYPAGKNPYGLRWMRHKSKSEPFEFRKIH